MSVPAALPSGVVTGVAAAAGVPPGVGATDNGGVKDGGGNASRVAVWPWRAWVMLGLQTGGSGLTPPTHWNVPEAGMYSSAVALPLSDPPAIRTLPASGPVGRRTAVCWARGSVI